MVNQKEFLERYTGEIENEFTSATGTPFSWVANHPKKWSLADATIQLGQETFSTPAINLDETLLAVGVGHDIHIYNLATQERVEILKGHTEVVEVVHFTNQTHDGGYFLASHSSVVMGDDSQVILWKLDTNGYSLPLGGDGQTKVDGQLGLWGSSVFMSDGQYLIYISNNASTQFDDQDGISRDASELPCINIWSIAEKNTKHRLLGHNDQIQCVIVSPNGKYLASASWDGTARIWDIITGSCLKVLGPFDGGQLWSVAFSPGGTHIAVSQESPKGRVHVCEVDTGKTVSTVEFHIWTRSLAWSPKGDMLACGADPGTAAIWDPYTGMEKMRWSLKFDDYGMGTMSLPRAVRFLGQDKIVFQLNEGTVYAYDFGKNQKYQFGRGPEDKQEKFPRAEMICTQRVVVVPDTNGVLRLWYW